MSLDPPGTYEQRLLPAALEDRLLGWFGRASGCAMLVVAAALWASLITWSVGDPSLTHATGGATRNVLGLPGAVVSDLLLQALGFGAALAILAPMLWSIELIVSERMRGSRAKITFYPISVLILSGALSALPVAGGWPLNHGYGGIIGDMIYGIGANAFGLINPDRGGLAAGVACFAAGFAAMFSSIGIELKDLAEAFAKRRADAAAARAVAVDPGRDPDERTEPHFAEPPLAAAPARRWFGGIFARRRPSGTAQDVTRAPAGYGPGPSGHPQPHWSHDWHDRSHDPYAHAYSAPVYPQDPAHAYAGPAGPYPPAYQPPQSYARPAAPHAMAEQVAQAFAPPAFGDPRDLMQQPVRQAPVLPPVLPPVSLAPASRPAGSRTPETDHHTETDDRFQSDDRPGTDHRPRVTDATDRPPSFDARTDTSSRRIAERFAPAGAAAQPSAAARPALAAASPKKPGHTLLGGMTFRRQEPAYKRPSLNLLKRPLPQKPGADFTPAMQRGTARLLEDVLSDFGVKGEIKDIRPGPVVTLFEFEPARGTKSSRIIGLADDIARSMSATAVRVAVVPGRNAIGIELPNARRETVLLREILETEVFRGTDAALPITLGKSIGGEPVVADLARMPHLLVAGTTGSGKSVGVNAMILSLLFRHTPDDCRFLMIDPKMLELSIYNGIPHLLTPVVTDPHKAIAALNWAVREMEERYKRMAQLSVRNIDVFNNRVRNAKKRGELMSRTVQTGFDRKTGQAIFENEKLALEPLPYIVIVVDEFADLMVVAGKDIEAAVQRLAQMARAAGIHLVMATQRPSVDIVTGTIKANFPTRISFKVASKIDSRTILNEQGAEQLLGQGDMLFSNNGAGQPVRVHGAFVADDEVEGIVAYLKSQGAPRYVEGVTDQPETAMTGDDDDAQSSDDDLYDRAVAVVLRDGKASTSYVQRRLSIGYNRAADLIERMEREGLISPANSVGKRDILAGRAAGGADAA